MALVALGAAALLLQRLSRPAGTPTARARAEALPPPIPRINLARLSADHPDSSAGRRDLFSYGAEPSKPPEDDPPTVIVEVPVQPELTPQPEPTPGLPPLNLKYLGSVENRAGIKVAVLLTDRKEVLTGRAGDTVANRYRIARIGLESVDLEDVASGQSRRIPLRGN